MRSKRKSESHIIDKKAIGIVEDLLPDYWTIRDYKPDYGIDLSIELFEHKNNAKGEVVYDTLGEHLFIQVKGMKKVIPAKYKIHERYNIEKKRLRETKTLSEIEVIKFQLETPEIFTIDRMSNAVPVLLFIVDVEEECIYFLCMNDYIDKLLIPKDNKYYNKKKKTIYVPVDNKITKDKKSHYPLLFLAKRPKYYSFFNKCSYQQNELHYINEDELTSIYPLFLDILLRFDIWEQSHLWPLLEHYHGLLLNLKEFKEPRMFKRVHKIDEATEESEWDTNYSWGKTYTRSQALHFMEIRSLWDGLSKLGNTYEETCREWFLPAYFSYISKM